MVSYGDGVVLLCLRPLPDWGWLIRGKRVPTDNQTTQPSMGESDMTLVQTILQTSLPITSAVIQRPN